MMSFKKVLFTSVCILAIPLFSSQRISDSGFQKEEKIVKLSKGQGKIVSKADRTSPMSSELFASIGKEKKLDLFSNMERRAIIEEDNFFGLKEYLSRDGFTLNFPINRSLHLATSLSPLNPERATKLSLRHRDKLTVFNSEVTLGFTGDYGLRFGVTQHF